MLYIILSASKQKLSSVAGIVNLHMLPGFYYSSNRLICCWLLFLLFLRVVRVDARVFWLGYVVQEAVAAWAFFVLVAKGRWLWFISVIHSPIDGLLCQTDSLKDVLHIWFSHLLWRLVELSRRAFLDGSLFLLIRWFWIEFINVFKLECLHGVFILAQSWVFK